MLENYVALSITNILAMLLLAFVVGRNNLLDRKMKRFFSTAIFCTILVILAEIGTSVFGQPVASFSLPNMVFNVLGFSLSSCYQHAFDCALAKIRSDIFHFSAK